MITPRDPLFGDSYGGPADRTDSLPPYSPEAERGVLGCCLLDPAKLVEARKAGVTSRWFYEVRHAELFELLGTLPPTDAGDPVLVTIALRAKEKLESIGGLAYLAELGDSIPSAANLGYYLEALRGYFQRRLVIDALTRLRCIVEDTGNSPAGVVSDTEALLEYVRRQAGADALPRILSAPDLLAAELSKPPVLVEGLLHQGSKLLLGGSSKSYKTWALTDLAVSVATGTPWLNFPCSQGKVLYVNLEIQAPFFRDRLAAVVAAKKVEVDSSLMVWNLRGHAADFRALLPKIRAQIQDDGYSLVIIDPTYKLLGECDENSARDIAALLNAVERLAVSTGAAVALANHYAKGNAAGKEAMDRISGSGVFARDPDSLVTFTRHEEDNAYTVDTILRNFPPVKSFVVRWEWPLFMRADELDPKRLRAAGGRPAEYTPDMLLEILGDQRLPSPEWQAQCADEMGVSQATFFKLRKHLEMTQRVLKSNIDRKWAQIRKNSQNPNHHNDQ